MMMNLLRLTLLLLSLHLGASWRDQQVFYFFSGVGPGVAVTSGMIHNCQHAYGPINGVQIGDQTGPLESLCLTYTDPSSPCGSIRDCEWVQTYKNQYNDVFVMRTCRPVTNGIAYVATNAVVGNNIWWFSAARKTWYPGQITSLSSEHQETWGDGLKAWTGNVIFNGTVSISGDSGSACFMENGDFLCTVTGNFGGLNNGRWIYPEGVQYRPTSAVPQAVAGFGSLFNSDPDR